MRRSAYVPKPELARLVHQDIDQFDQLNEKAQMKFWAFFMRQGIYRK